MVIGEIVRIHPTMIDAVRKFPTSFAARLLKRAYLDSAIINNTIPLELVAEETGFIRTINPGGTAGVVQFSSFWMDVPFSFLQSQEEEWEIKREVTNEEFVSGII